MIRYQNKHFLIDDKKTFLYGAECHYFRIDPSQWADRLQKIKDAGFNLVSTYVPWIWHEPKEGQFDFEGTTHPRRNLVAFLDLCASFGLYCIVRPGPYVMSELKNEGIPQWLLDAYPEVIARTKSGEVHPTRVVSYLHPTYLQIVEKWYKEVCSRVAPRLITNGGPIIMFQLDNEIGMLHWVTNTADHNPHALQRFEVYQSSVKAQPQTELASHWMWAEFARHDYAEYVKALKKMAEENGINVPFIVNVHGFKDFSVYSRGVDYPIGLSQLRDAATVDDVVLAGDFYPGKIGYDNFHDLLLSSALTEAVGNPEQPLFSAEFQSGRLADRPRVYPSDVDLITRLCVASGMNALNYYMYCGGDNVEGIGLFGRRHEWQAPIASNGDLRPSYGVTRHLGELFNTFGEMLCESPKVADTYIGFYPPYYATEVVNCQDPTVQRVIQEIASQREHFHFDGMWRLLSAGNISYGAVDVLKTDLDVTQYPTLWMCTTKYMDRATQEKLVGYVKNGGNLILGPQVPMYDLNGEMCEILAQNCGVSIVSEHHGYHRVTVCDIDSVFCRQYTVFAKPDDATLVAHGEQGEEEVTAYVRGLGQGRVLVLGVGLTHEYQYQLEVIHRLAHLMGIQPHLQVTDENVVVTARTGSDGSLISIINVDDIARETRVIRGREDVFGGNTVHLEPRSGKLLPVQFQLADGVIINYSTVEVVRVDTTEAGIDVEVYVPAGQSGIVSWALAEDMQLEAGGSTQLEFEPAHGNKIVRIPPSSKPQRVSFRVVSNHSFPKVGAH
ncbi:beta-galactosidase [Alicyclobacillus pomorum]|uniref:beta-galactosidase n=1 Tax=Alicyclobacillus pomorum TaxID=204470 RepID=UPI0003FE91A4|nr:alpha-amylase family protein [Alicyclobacillus pomorum]